MQIQLGISKVFRQSDLRKQYRPRSDATEGDIWLEVCTTMWALIQVLKSVKIVLLNDSGQWVSSLFSFLLISTDYSAHKY